MFCLSWETSWEHGWTSLPDKDPVLQNSDPKLGAKKKEGIVLLLLLLLKLVVRLDYISKVQSIGLIFHLLDGHYYYLYGTFFFFFHFY
jgi:hypothetical protein